jgi:tRNA pseudouridine55 synthase
MTTKTTRIKRDVHGILLLDKPVGMTSNQALQATKRLLQARKAGHTGSLDPLATGLLPLCFGEATKVSQFLLEADKRYQVVLRLGESTNTYDAEGEVTAVRPVSLDRGRIEQALARFCGEIDQVPPMYSAIKQDGQPLYKLARAGITVERPPRRVTIHEIRLLDWHDTRLELDVACSKGTYIRSLAHDLGELLGCGAHVTGLRRTATGGFGIGQAISLEAFQALSDKDRLACLISEDQALTHLPAVNLSVNTAYYLCQGQVVTTRHEAGPGLVRLYGPDGHFIGLGEVQDDGQVAPKRLMRPAEQADITQEIG